MSVSQRPGSSKSQQKAGAKAAAVAAKPERKSVEGAEGGELASGAGRGPLRGSQPPSEAEEPAESDELDAVEPDRRFRLKRHLRNVSAMSISAVIHMVALVTLGVLVIEPKAVTQMQEVIAEVMEELDPRDELKVELEQQLTEVRDQTTEVFSSSPVVGVVGAAGPQGMISAPTMDKALLEQVVNSEVNVEGIILDIPSTRKLIVEAPEGQVGDARAVVSSYQDALDRITQEILWMLD
jgi:hypothetical protein